MGGAAAIIPVNVTQERLKTVQAKRGFLSRLLKRQEVTTPAAMSFGNQYMHELHGVDSAPVALAFREAILDRFPEPWAATRALVDYLSIGVLEVYVRGYSKEEQTIPAWSAEVAFSGCAGQAEVSAMLASHWFSLWCEELTREGRLDIFEDSGITIDPHRFVPPEDPHFVPFGRYGYGVWMVMESTQSNDTSDIPWPFNRGVEIDATSESDISRTDLDTTAVDYVFETAPQDECLCQWCSPSFDAAAMESLFDE